MLARKGSSIKEVVRHAIPPHGPPPDRSSRLGGSWRVLAACAAAALFAAILFLPSSASATISASKPTGLAAALVDADSGDEYDGVVTLTWNAPADDASSVTGYQVLRRQPGVDAVGVFHTLVDNTSTTDTSCEDFSANGPGAAYTYRVKAWRDTALSGRSRWTRIDLPASYTPPSPDTTPPPDTVPPPPVTEAPRRTRHRKSRAVMPMAEMTKSTRPSFRSPRKSCLGTKYKHR